MLTSKYIAVGLPDIQTLPFIRIRNIVSGRSPLSTRLQMLSRIMPSVNEPEAFADKLGLVEQELGTCHAAIVAFVGAFGADAASAKREIERFNDMQARIPEEVSRNGLDIEALFDALAPMLIFAESVNTAPMRGLNFFKAFEALENNLSGQAAAEVGNCTLCAFIFALFALSYGGLAGEAKEISSEHSRAYVEVDGQIKLYEHLRPDWDKWSRRHPSKLFGERENWQEIFVGSDETAYCLATNLGLARLKEKCPSDQHPQLERLYKYFINTNHLSDFNHGTSLMPSSVFTFVSSLLALIIQETFYFGFLKNMEPEKRSLFHNTFQVVEAINPYSFDLYANWAKLLERDAARAYEELQLVVNEAQIRQAP